MTSPAARAAHLARRVATCLSTLCLCAMWGCSNDEGGGPQGPRPAGGGEFAVTIVGEEVVFVGQEACFTPSVAGESRPEALTWSWGDQSSSSRLGVDAEACHTWTTPGYVLVAVEGDGGSDAMGVAVVHEPSELPPSMATSIAYDSERGRVWVVNPDAGSVAELSLKRPEEGFLAFDREIAVCERPRTLTLLGDSLWVSCQGDDAVARVVLGGLPKLDAVYPLGHGTAPYGVAADPRGGHIWVTLQGTGELASFAVADDGAPVGRLDEVDAIHRVAVGADARGLGVRHDGTVAVTRWRGSDSGSEVRFVDGSDPSRPLVVEALSLPAEILPDSDTNHAGVPSFQNHAAFDPSGRRGFLPSLKANVVSGVFKRGIDLTFETTARAHLVVIDAIPGEATVEERRASFDDLDFTSSVAFSPLGERAYLAFQGAERVQILDPFSFNVAGSIDDAGKAPQGLLTNSDGSLLFVQAFLSRTVRVYDVSDLSAGEPPMISEVATVASEPLDADVLLGKRIFYSARDPRMSDSSYVSCASCHLDGEGDQLVWDFTGRGEGLRNTIPLRGRAGLGHGALHWSANFDEVQDFEHDIRGPQAGTGFLDDDLFLAGRDTPLGVTKTGWSPELDALSAYVTSLSGWGLSPFRRAGDATWEATRDRGRDLFQSSTTGCADCHVPPTFTDSGFDGPATPRLHDVGTLGSGSGGRLGGELPGLDTPTLRGLWKSGPYLHDGSADTLRAVLTERNAGDRHGRTSQLSQDELSALETYLMSLDELE
jgi:DNA-binding beta-propeller fold protein YncE/mono/diheme cytochrome c family protein